MVAPIVAAGIKYGVGKMLESQGLPSGLTNPKGFVLDKLRSGVDSALGVTPGTTGMLTDPKGTLVGMAKDKAKQVAQDAYNADDSPMSAADAGGGMAAMEYEGNYKRGGKVKAKSASNRGDGIAKRGKTRGRMV